MSGPLDDLSVATACGAALDDLAHLVGVARPLLPRVGYRGMLPEPFISELEVRARLGAHIVAFHRRTQHDIVLAERLPSESPLQRERYVVLAGMGEVNGYDVDRVIGAWTDWRAVLGESRVRAGDIIVEVSPRQWWPEGERP